MSSYRCAAGASDPDGAPRTYHLDTAPQGMTIDANGRICWTTNRDLIAASPYAMQVSVTDPYGATLSQSFSLVVQRDQQAPVVFLQVDPPRANVGSTVTFLVRASDNVGVTSVHLAVSGSNYSHDVDLDANGVGTLLVDTLGTFSVTATASDGEGLTGTATAGLQVIDSNDQHPPTLSISTPTQSASVTALTDVVGSVQDDGSVQSWRLDLLSLQGDVLAVLGQGSAAVSNGVLGHFDPTLLSNDTYVLRLTAQDNAGNVSSMQHQVNVQGHLKLGDFTLSFTDLTIPLAGIPITVSRTYDTLQAGKQGDFGYGWRLDLGDAQLQVNLIDGAELGWGGLPAFLDGTRVYLTLPGGDRQGFTFRPVLVNPFFHQWAPYFAPDPGNFTALTVPDTLLERDDSSGEFFSYDESGIHTYNPADPAYGTIYNLIDPAGLTTTVDASSGRLLSMKDRHGNQLTFMDEGISSNRGVAVGFQRDPHGRITAVVDPRGNAVRYAYDSAGNLIQVTDRAGQVQAQYNYRNEPQFAHYLAHVYRVEDGVPVPDLTPSYGSDLTNPNAYRRLIGLTDATGQTVSLQYNVAVKRQTVTDPSLPSGQQTSTEDFDARGNVTQTTDPLGEQTRASFQPGSDLPDTITQVGDPNNPSDDRTTTIHHDQQLPWRVSQVDAPGQSTYMSYADAAHPDLPTSIASSTGTASQLRYDDSGNVTSSVTPDGVATTYVYDEQGNLKSAMSGAAAVHYDYAAQGWLSDQTNSDGVTATYSHDANGNATGSSWLWVDPANPGHQVPLSSAMQYDANDRAFRSTDDSGLVQLAQYDSQGRVKQSTDAHGNTTETVYDVRGQAVQTISRYPNGSVQTTTRTVYDAQGQAIWQLEPYTPDTTLADRRGTRTFFDAAGRVVRSEQRGGLDVALQAGPNGGVQAVVAAEGVVLSWSEAVYDALGQVRQTRNSAGLRTDYEYDSAGRQTAVEQWDTTGASPRRLSRTETVYNGAGQVERARNALHADGSLKAADEGWTVYSHDDAGRVVKTTYPDGTFTTVHYDARGQQDAMTDQLGRTTDLGYDDGGRLTRVTQPAVPDPLQGGALVRPVTLYGYDRYGNHISTTDALGRVTTWTYNEHGQQTSHTLPAVAGQPNATERWTYTTDGLVNTYVDFNGTQMHYHYDYELSGPGTPVHRDGLLVQADYTPAGQSSPTEAVGYTYDSHSRLHQVTNAGQVFSWDYGADGQLTVVSGPAGVLHYGYDNEGRHTLTWSEEAGQAGVAATRVEYGYDALGRLTAVREMVRNGVTLPSVAQTNYDYGADGMLRSVTLPNGVHGDYAYDGMGRLQSLVQHDGGGNLLASYVYVHTLDGQIASLSETVKQPDGSSVTTTSSYGYDDLNRLVHEQVDTAGTANDYTNDYMLDLAGNQRQKQTTRPGQPTETVDGSFDARDRLTQEVVRHSGTTVQTVNYSCDSNGALTLRTSSDGSQAQYTWNLRGQLALAHVSQSEGGVLVVEDAHYSYDPDGLRWRQEVTTTQGSGTPQTEVKRLLLDGNNPTGYAQVIEERTDSGLLVASYVHGLEPISQYRAGTLAFYLLDGHSGVRLLLGASAAVLAAYRYDAFGSLVSPGTALANPLLYRGEWYDPVLGQYALRARYYDPASGRFTSADSWAGEQTRPQTLNKYLYAVGNPLAYADPSGRDPSLAGFGAQISSALSWAGRTISATAQVLFRFSGLQWLARAAFRLFVGVSDSIGPLYYRLYLWAIAYGWAAQRLAYWYEQKGQFQISAAVSIIQVLAEVPDFLQRGALLLANALDEQNSYKGTGPGAGNYWENKAGVNIGGNAKGIDDWDDGSKTITQFKALAPESDKKFQDEIRGALNKLQTASQDSATDYEVKGPGGSTAARIKGSDGKNFVVSVLIPDADRGRLGTTGFGNWLAKVLREFNGRPQNAGKNFRVIIAANPRWRK